MASKTTYDPKAEYIVAPGGRISLPPTAATPAAATPFKTFITYKDTDAQGEQVRFTMSHRTPQEIAYLVEVKRIILPAPPKAAGETKGGKS